MSEKLKSFLTNDTYFTVLILLLVGIGSFGLGRMSVLDGVQTAAVVEGGSTFTPITSETIADTAPDTSGVPVVASKSGTKYHLFDCPGAKQMKIENRIEFPSIEAARAAGYSAAGNCPGL